MMKIDLKDAYLTVPIVKHHRKFLRFSVARQELPIQTPPLGLGTAPRTFTKLLYVFFRLRQRIRQKISSRRCVCFAHAGQGCLLCSMSLCLQVSMFAN